MLYFISERHTLKSKYHHHVLYEHLSFRIQELSAFVLIIIYDRNRVKQEHMSKTHKHGESYDWVGSHK